MKNKRHFSRIKFDVQTQLILHEKIYRAELLDISLNGALMVFEDEIPIQAGDSCALKIHLPSSNINLRFDVKLVHHEDGAYGFKFVQVDLETLTHLRRIIELNLGDGDQVTRELFFLMQ